MRNGRRAKVSEAVQLKEYAAFTRHSSPQKQYGLRPPLSTRYTPGAHPTKMMEQLYSNVLTFALLRPSPGFFFHTSLSGSSDPPRPTASRIHGRRATGATADPSATGAAVRSSVGTGQASKRAQPHITSSVRIQ